MYKKTYLAILAGLVSLSAQAKQCDIELTKISCESRQGIYFRAGSGPVEEWAHTTPYNVPENADMAVAVCNFKNKNMLNGTISEHSLIPNLIASIGNNAKLRIDVENSANIKVQDKLVVGQVLPEGIPQINTAPVEELPEPDVATPALIADIVQGKIGKDVNLQIQIEDSANVHLLGENATLHVGKASLLEEVVNKTRNGEVHEIDSGCIQISVKDTANVKGSATSKVYIRDGQLEDENIDYTFARSNVRVAKFNVANVTGSELHIFDGELSDESVDTDSVADSTVQLVFNSVGNAITDKLRVIDGELVDEVLDIFNAERSTLSVRLMDVANHTGKDLHIHAGELLDEVLDGQNLIDTRIHVHLHRSGNGTTSDKVYVKHGELIDEVLDIELLSASQVDVTLNSSANSTALDNEVRHGELLDETVDVGNVDNSQIRIGLTDVGNVTGLGTTTVDSGELVDEVLDIHQNMLQTSATINIAGTANVSATNLMINQGELLDESLDVMDVIGGSINITMRDTGNAYRVDKLTITNGELVDEVLDNNLISDATVYVSLDSVAQVGIKGFMDNHVASSITLENSELLDEVVDTQVSMTGGTGSVSVINTANASASDLVLTNSALVNRMINIPEPHPMSVSKAFSENWRKHTK